MPDLMAMLRALDSSLPADVRAMSATALVLAAVATLALLAVALVWAMRQPVFTIRAVRVDGDVTRNSVATLRAHTAARLNGSFFTLDLAGAQRAFEGVPWVRSAVVRRLWPDRLSVSLEEHRAVALWGDGADLMVNSHGEVFAANPGDVEDDHLPTLQGPEGSAAAMLSMLRRLEPVLAALDTRIGALVLSGRGSWAIELENGADIELGRGSEAELAQRTQAFVASVGSVIARYERALVYADLRHHQGYALRLKGVSTASDLPNPRN